MITQGAKSTNDQEYAVGGEFEKCSVFGSKRIIILAKDRKNGCKRTRKLTDSRGFALYNFTATTTTNHKHMTSIPTATIPRCIMTPTMLYVPVVRSVYTSTPAALVKR